MYPGGAAVITVKEVTLRYKATGYMLSVDGSKWN
jgi:hypothetical protein